MRAAVDQGEDLTVVDYGDDEEAQEEAAVEEFEPTEDEAAPATEEEAQ